MNIGVKRMNMKPSSTRDQILNMLKVKKRLTVFEMAKQLGITEMAVRRHLNALERDSFVESTLVRQSMGRPMHVYRLTAKGEEQFPQHHKHMVIEILEDAAEMGGKDFVDQLFEKRRNRLKQKFYQRFDNKTFDEKVNELAAIQNEQGYMVELEKCQDGRYVLKEYNCPMSDVAKRFEAACTNELQLFRDCIKNAEIIPSACMAHGDDYCQYEIKRKE
jgi:DeoR family transcriptional regulator, suf operon transcriptional repressor